MSVFVFDMGGTLMEYKGMPHAWTEYYPQGFRRIAEDFGVEVSEAEIDQSVSIMKQFNPRICYRENDFAPEYIMGETLKHWRKFPDLTQAVYSFLGGMNLVSVIYQDTIPVLKELREKGHIIGCFTDLPPVMPDEMFREDIADILPYIDMYVSSQSCGYRKPNKFGLQKIADQYKVPVSSLIFAGDEEKDKKTAENAGCRFIWIDRKDSTGQRGLEQILRT